MTPDQISKLPPELRKAAELCEKATKGPWVDVTETPYMDIIHGEHGAQVISIHQGIHHEEDAEFITESRTALPLALTWGLQVDHAFKNFHRNLCERFDYCHDEKDWERDQVSLEEHIAAKLLQVVEERDARDAQLSRIAETVAKLPSITGLQTGCVKDHSLIWMAIRDAQDAYRDTLARHQREAKQHAGRAETAEATIATLTRELGKLNKLAERHMLSHANQCNVAAFKVAEDFVTATIAALSYTPEGCK